jgi:hypothetical protein
VFSLSLSLSPGLKGSKGLRRVATFFSAETYLHTVETSRKCFGAQTARTQRQATSSSTTEFFRGWLCRSPRDPPPFAAVVRAAAAGWHGHALSQSVAGRVTTPLVSDRTSSGGGRAASGTLSGCRCPGAGRRGRAIVQATATEDRAFELATELACRRKHKLQQQGNGQCVSQSYQPRQRDRTRVIRIQLRSVTTRLALLKRSGYHTYS